MNRAVLKSELYTTPKKSQSHTTAKRTSEERKLTSLQWTLLRQINLYTVQYTNGTSASRHVTHTASDDLNFCGIKNYEYFHSPLDGITPWH